MKSNSNSGLNTAFNPTQEHRIQFTDSFLTNTLTSTGYKPQTAIAELVDNSIDAHASKIEITIDKNQIVIKDDGCGMSKYELLQAMNFGSNKGYESNKIGYYHTGLKSSVINLLNLDGDCTMEIQTNDGDNASGLYWSPSESVITFKELQGNRETQGTTITLTGIVSYKPGELKKYFGTLYYHTLKNEDTQIIINNSILTPVDPLYRNDDLVLKNTLTAKVQGHEIQLEAVLLNDAIQQSSWDTDSARNTWSYAKGGGYVRYGNRYLNMGGMLDVKDFDPWYSKVRIEFTIPKELTKIFRVPFNKTEGISLKHEGLENVRQKFDELLNWGRNIRLKQNKNDKDKKVEENLNNLLNRRASKAGIALRKQRGDKKVTFTANENKEPRENKPKKITQPPVIHNDRFRVTWEDLGMGVFLDMGYVDDIFTITFNIKHPFYYEIFEKADTEHQLYFLEIMASAAYSQYKVSEDYTHINMLEFWNDYWLTFGRTLSRLIQG